MSEYALYIKINIHICNKKFISFNFRNIYFINEFISCTLTKIISFSSYIILNYKYNNLTINGSKNYMFFICYNCVNISLF